MTVSGMTWATMPTELWVNIFSQLNGKALDTTSCVCTVFHSIIKAHDEWWKKEAETKIRGPLPKIEKTWKSWCYKPSPLTFNADFLCESEIVKTEKMASLSEVTIDFENHTITLHNNSEGLDLRVSFLLKKIPGIVLCEAPGGHHWYQTEKSKLSYFGPLNNIGSIEIPSHADSVKFEILKSDSTAQFFKVIFDEPEQFDQ